MLGGLWRPIGVSPPRPLPRSIPYTLQLGKESFPKGVLGGRMPGGLWQPVAACGSLWRRIGSPLTNLCSDAGVGMLGLEGSWHSGCWLAGWWEVVSHARAQRSSADFQSHQCKTVICTFVVVLE